MAAEPEVTRLVALLKPLRVRKEVETFRVWSEVMETGFSIYRMGKTDGVFTGS
jgi:hypothetical protein